eukprot:CAMPEP_0171457304 /NCGR_PEP_ID=MMETSP0945-20130129/3439_1 /TAXON_ID=109269 /ORGANISM="Vaucheria litorea, Strain CCMP2940" /LENGTH=320 /DNA_ID=CAMNT_0011982891 /DNA_START=90 /DNA_END=1052 /DNA_ORIENTATION=-
MYFKVELEEKDRNKGPREMGMLEDFWEKCSLLSSKRQRIYKIGANSTVNFEILPNTEALAGKDDQNTVDEYIVFYNMKRHSEKFRVRLRISSKQRKMFFLTPGPKCSFHHWTLESNIAAFLSCYMRFWDELKGIGLNNFLENFGSSQIMQFMENEWLLFLWKNGEETGDVVEQQLDDDNEGDLKGVKGHFSQAEKRGVSNESESEDGLGESSRRFFALDFELNCLTDELLFCVLSHRGHVGEFGHKLSNLLFLVIFKHEEFDQFLDKNGENLEAVEGRELPKMLEMFVKKLDRFLSFFPCPKTGLKPLLDLRKLIRGSAR